jgi:hypothetical protein
LIEIVSCIAILVQDGKLCSLLSENGSSEEAPVSYFDQRLFDLLTSLQNHLFSYCMHLGPNHVSFVGVRFLHFSRLSSIKMQEVFFCKMVGTRRSTVEDAYGPHLPPS